MNISSPKKIYDDLDKFFANKTVHDANRDKYQVCNLTDVANKLSICLVFMSDWSMEYNSYDTTYIRGKGVVFVFPCYWLSVPKELAMQFFTTIIEEFYNTKVIEWIGSNTGNSGSSNGNCCPCGIG